MYRCGVNQPAQYQQCLVSAGGGMLVAAVIAGQAMNI